MKGNTDLDECHYCTNPERFVVRTREADTFVSQQALRICGKHIARAVHQIEDSVNSSARSVWLEVASLEGW